MAIKLYNTLTRTTEDFTSLSPNKVGIYSCGPTVYYYAHLGNLRAFLLSDLLKRLFLYRGYAVTQVMNITDVGHLTDDADEGEDKLEKASRRENRTAQEIATFYYDVFRADLKKINFSDEETIFPFATQHIQEQIDLIKILETKGFTYRTSDGIYFDTSRYPAYAELGKLDLAGMQEGARVESNPEKKNPSDFALWKFSDPNTNRQQEWESPWGVGFPGWHIECSAMSMKYLGQTFDIHTGGIDHIPVHHSNERAQSECATNQPYANYWLHSEFMNIDGQKMSKSLGNVFTLADLIERGFDPLAYRYWLLTGHYRRQVNFTWTALEASAVAYKKLRQFISDLANSTDWSTGELIPSYLQSFDEAIDNDLNTPQALATLWELVKDPKVSAADKLVTIFHFDQVLGLRLHDATETVSIPEEVLALVKDREQARQNKDWTKSDVIRQQLLSLGYQVEDSNEGPKIRPV